MILKQFGILSRIPNTQISTNDLGCETIPGDDCILGGGASQVIPSCSVPVETRAGTGKMQHEIRQFLHFWTCLQSVAMQ